MYPFFAKPKAITRSLLLLTWISSCATAFAQDVTATAGTDLTTPAFRGTTATKALGTSEPTDGSEFGNVLLWGAIAGGAYYAYEEVTKTKKEDAATNGPSSANASQTLNCNQVWSGPYDPQISSYCSGACSYYNLGSANYSSARSYCNIMSSLDSTALSKCSVCGKI